MMLNRKEVSSHCDCVAQARVAMGAQNWGAPSTLEVGSNDYEQTCITGG